MFREESAIEEEKKKKEKENEKGSITIERGVRGPAERELAPKGRCFGDF